MNTHGSFVHNNPNLENKQINKLYIHIMKHYSLWKTNEPLTEQQHAWILDVLSKRTDLQKDICCMCVWYSLSCVQLFWDATDYSLPGSSVLGISSQEILSEWVAIPFSRRGSSQPRDQAHVFCIADRCFIIWATRKSNLGEKKIRTVVSWGRAGVQWVHGDFMEWWK